MMRRILFLSFCASSLRLFTLTVPLIEVILCPMNARFITLLLEQGKRDFGLSYSFIIIAQISI